MPTLIEIAGIKKPHDFAELEGTSFLPLMIDPDVPPSAWKSAAFTQYPRCSGTAAAGRAISGPLTPVEFPTNDACTFNNATTFFAMGYSIRTDEWRYTRWVGWKGAVLQSPGFFKYKNEDSSIGNEDSLMILP